MSEEIPICHNTPMMPVKRYRNKPDGKIYRDFRCCYCWNKKTREVKTISEAGKSEIRATTTWEALMEAENEYYGTYAKGVLVR
jgi:hypothetical protein